MSRIDDLIAELCPDGVKYLSLSDIGATYGGLTGKSKADFENGNYPYISYMNIFNNLELDGEVADFVSVKVGEKQNAIRVGDVLFAGSSETANEVGMSCVVTVEPKKTSYLNSFSFGYRFFDTTLLCPGFTKYLFRSTNVRKDIVKCASGVTRFNLSKQRLLKIRIPIPPLPIQHEIVNILDTFSKLEAELEAELEARKQQYEYYRGELLRFEDDVTYRRLFELGNWSGGGTPSKSVQAYWKNGTIPWLSPKDMTTPVVRETQDRISMHAIEGSATKLIQKNSIAVVVRSSILDKKLPVSLIPFETTLNQDMKALTVNEEVLPSYVLYAIRSRSHEILRACRKTGGSVASIDTSKLMQYEIPVPTLAEQERIVSILDSFDTLVNDLSSGLPAEIAARRQQYEHYRDRLLTFREKTT